MNLEKTDRRWVGDGRTNRNVRAIGSVYCNMNGVMFSVLQAVLRRKVRRYCIMAFATRRD